MLVKGFIVLVLLLILASLGSALYSMLADDGQSERTVKALTVRISLSIALFILLMIGYATGLITPHGLG